MLSRRLTQAFVHLTILAATLPAACADADGSSRQSVLKEIHALTASHSYFKAGALLDKLHQKVGADDLEVTLAAARLYRDMGLSARAQTEYEHALRINSGCTEAGVALSEIYMQGLNTRKALEFARRAYNSNPHATSAQVALSSALIASGMFREAEQELAKLLKTSPNDAQVQYVAYNLALERGQLSTAQNHLEGAVRLAPNRPDWLIDLSELYKAQGEYSNARRMLEKALAIDPYSLDALNKLAIIQEFYFHDYDQAIEQYKNILVIDQDSVTALAGLDRCKIKKNDLAGAMRFELSNVIANFYGLFGKTKSD
ncbi:MAG TPA: tetratricopeptide repeat protein [Planktothrix sp.]|jgi:tetratricopeptide (TPR) repeat protein